MDRFIWLDSENVANLDAIAYFRVQSDQLVDVVFRDGQHRLIQVEGEYAEALNRVLANALNAPEKPIGIVDLRAVMPRAVEREGEAANVIDIDENV